MKINKTKKATPMRDSKKESIFNMLTSILKAGGYVVRREKLKQGPGWRVVSGVCTRSDQKLIFVESRMTQDDQISFLIGQILSFGVQPSPEALAKLPETIQHQLRGETVDAEAAA